MLYITSIFFQMYLADESENWSRDETDYLFQLSRFYFVLFY